MEPECLDLNVINHFKISEIGSSKMYKRFSESFFNRISTHHSMPTRTSIIKRISTTNSNSNSRMSRNSVIQVKMNINLQTKQEQSSEWHVIQQTLSMGGARVGRGCSVTRDCQTNPGRPALVAIDIRIRCTPRELALTNFTEGGGKSADVVMNFTDYSFTRTLPLVILNESTIRYWMVTILPLPMFKFCSGAQLTKNFDVT